MNYITYMVMVVKWDVSDTVGKPPRTPSTHIVRVYDECSTGDPIEDALNEVSNLTGWCVEDAIVAKIIS